MQRHLQPRFPGANARQHHDHESQVQSTARQSVAPHMSEWQLQQMFPPGTLLANDSKSRYGKNMIRWGERTAERVQVHQEKQKKEDFHVDVSPGNWTHPGGNDARGACGLSQRVTGDAAAR